MCLVINGIIRKTIKILSFVFPNLHVYLLKLLHVVHAQVFK